MMLTRKKLIFMKKYKKEELKIGRNGEGEDWVTGRNNTKIKSPPGRGKGWVQKGNLI